MCRNRRSSVESRSRNTFFYLILLWSSIESYSVITVFICFQIPACQCPSSRDPRARRVLSARSPRRSSSNNSCWLLGQLPARADPESCRPPTCPPTYKAVAHITTCAFSWYQKAWEGVHQCHNGGEVAVTNLPLLPVFPQL